MAEFISILFISSFFFAVCIIWFVIKKIKLKIQAQGKPEVFVIDKKQITVYQIKEFKYGDRVLVAKAITQQGVKLNDNQIIELSKILGDSIEWIDCYERDYTSSKYAYYEDKRVYFN
jgi:hypothetical protein